MDQIQRLRCATDVPVMVKVFLDGREMCYVDEFDTNVEVLGIG